MRSLEVEVGRRGHRHPSIPYTMSAHWITLLNALCTLLPIVAFASPATVLLPAVADCGRRRSDGRGADAPHDPIEMAPLALTTQMLQCFLFGIYALHFSMVTLVGSRGRAGS